MVYPVNQRLEQLFRPAQALQAGTLFPELLKPMNGFAQPRTACANEKQAMAFSLWELRLYLDTHPQDQQALQIFHQLCSQTEAPNYACVWADACGQDHWAWIDQPWPWTFPGCGE